MLFPISRSISHHSQLTEVCYPTHIFCNSFFIDFLFIYSLSNDPVTLVTTFTLILILKPSFKRMPSSTTGD